MILLITGSCQIQIVIVKDFVISSNITSLTKESIWHRLVMKRVIYSPGSEDVLWFIKTSPMFHQPGVDDDFIFIFGWNVSLSEEVWVSHTFNGVEKYNFKGTCSFSFTASRILCDFNSYSQSIFFHEDSGVPSWSEEGCETRRRPHVRKYNSHKDKTIAAQLPLLLPSCTAMCPGTPRPSDLQMNLWMFKLVSWGSKVNCRYKS